MRDEVMLGLRGQFKRAYIVNLNEERQHQLKISSDAAKIPVSKRKIVTVELGDMTLSVAC